MNRWSILLVVTALLMAPSFGAANPNGVGEGTFDAQCGGACHGDAPGRPWHHASVLSV